MGKEKDISTKDKKEDDNMDATMNIERHCSIAESIINSCKEVKSMRDGKTPKRRWKDFAENTRKQISKDKD